MKSIKIKLFGCLMVAYATTSNLSFAQTNNATNISTAKPSDQIELQLSNYEARAFIFETNLTVEPEKLSDQDQVMAFQPLYSAIDILRWRQPNMDRKEKAELWLTVLASIDRHLGAIPAVDISGFVPPPPGYKGTIGPWGMLPPDTNDIADYTYYVNAVRANTRKAKKAVFLNELARINDWDAAPGIEGFIRDSYSSSDADKQEFEGLLNQATLSAPRRQQLKELFDKTH
jgi:hypothetical protein